MNGQMNRWIIGCMDGHGWREVGIYAYMAMDGWMDRCMGVGMSAWTPRDGGKDGWMHQQPWMEGYMDGWMAMDG